MRTRWLHALVVLALAFAPAGAALAQATLAAPAGGPAACCCGPMAEQCASARLAASGHGCPCASRDDAPAVPVAPPAPAGERPAMQAGPSVDALLAVVGLVVPDAEAPAPRALGAARDSGESSLFVLDCAFRL